MSLEPQAARRSRELMRSRTGRNLDAVRGGAQAHNRRRRERCKLVEEPALFGKVKRLPLRGCSPQRRLPPSSPRPSASRVAGTERNILMVLLAQRPRCRQHRHALTRMFPLPGSTGAEADLVNSGCPEGDGSSMRWNLALDRGRQSWRRAGEWRTSNTSENASACSKQRTGFTLIRFVFQRWPPCEQGVHCSCRQGLDLRCRLTPGPVIAGFDRRVTAACCRIPARAGGSDPCLPPRAPRTNLSQGTRQRPRQVARGRALPQERTTRRPRLDSEFMPQGDRKPLHSDRSHPSSGEFFTRIFSWLTDAPRPAGLSCICSNGDANDSDPVSPRNQTQGTDHERKTTGKKRETSWPERTTYKRRTIVVPRRPPDVAAKARSATEGRTLQVAIDGQPLGCCRSSRAASSRSACPIGPTSRRSTSRATSSISTPHFVAAERLRCAGRPPRLPASTRRTQQ